MISPEVQRAAIEDYCRGRGYVVAGWMEGLDESGSRSRSAWWPRLDQAVAAVEAGEYDLLVVWKFSRIARHRLRWAVAIDRVEEAGGRIESATEQVDTSTSTGRFTRGMLAELQAFEAERIGETWKETHARRVASGRPANGKPRYGYRYDVEAKLHVPDSATGPVLADVYRRYVAGESVYALVRWLNANGWRTTAGRMWSDRSLRRVMDSGFASGRFLAGGELHRGVHEALIDEDLWTAFLDARVARRARPARSERSQYLLSGLVRCGRCGFPMVAGQFGHARASKYRCRSGKESGPLVCRGGYVTASMVEEHVKEWLREVAAEVDGRAGVARVAAARRVSLESDLARLEREVVRADEALQRLVVSNAETPLPPVVYRRSLEELGVRRDELVVVLEGVRRDARRVVADPAGVASGLLEEWDRWLVPVRREVLRGLLDCVLVFSGRPRAVLRVVPAWETRSGGS